MRSRVRVGSTEGASTSTPAARECRYSAANFRARIRRAVENAGNELWRNVRGQNGDVPFRERRIGDSRPVAILTHDGDSLRFQQLLQVESRSSPGQIARSARANASRAVWQGRAAFRSARATVKIRSRFVSYAGHRHERSGNCICQVGVVVAAARSCTTTRSKINYLARVSGVSEAGFRTRYCREAGLGLLWRMEAAREAEKVVEAARTKGIPAGDSVHPRHHTWITGCGVRRILRQLR